MELEKTKKEADQKPRWASMTMITLSYLLRAELIIITLVQSKSPISYRRRRRSRSYSPPFRCPRSHRSRSPLRYNSRSTYEGRRRSYRDSKDISESMRYCRSDYHHSSSSRRSRSVSPQKRKSKQMIRSCQDIDVIAHLVGDKKRHKETKSTPRDDEKTNLKRRTRSRSRSVEDSTDKKDEARGQGQDLVKAGKEPETHPERGRSRSKSLEVNNDSHEDINVAEDIKEERRGRSMSRSLETKHKSSRRNELDENKDTGSRRRSRSRSVDGKRSHAKETQSRDKTSKRSSGRRSRSVFSEGRHRRERRPSPEYSDENKSSSRRKGHSRSREKRESSRDKISKRHKRLRSASLGDDNGKGDRSPSPISSE
ncbi:hypothetical protein YC2023_005064 [Brassica napus]